MNAPRDGNRVVVSMFTLNTDGITPVNVSINPTTHAVRISDGTTGTSFSSVNAQRNANRIPVMWGVSSADGKTPIPIYADSTGAVLTKST